MDANNSSDSCRMTLQNMRAFIPKIIKSPVPVFGKAPGLRHKLISAQGETRRYMLAFAPGDDVMAGLFAFADQEKLRSATISGVGALRQVTFAFFDPAQKAFKSIYVDQQSEVNILNGNISLHDGKYAVHVHGSVSLENGNTKGGHLVYTYVNPAMELEITETAVALNRSHFDGCSGLFLLEP